MTVLGSSVGSHIVSLLAYAIVLIRAATKVYSGLKGRDIDPNHGTGVVSRSHCKYM